MTGFDPEAATRAYLASLPHAASMAQHWIGLAGFVAVAAAAALEARRDPSRWIRARFEKDRPRPWLVTGANALLFGAWIFMALWLVRLATGAPANPDGLIVRIGLFAVAASLVAAVARRWPRLWAPVCGAVAALAVFVLGWAPFVAASGPARLPEVSGPVGQGVTALVHNAGLAARQVYLTPGRSLDADVTGTNAAPRVSITQGLQAEGPAEARAMLAHVMGHFAHGDPRSLAVLLAALTMGGFLFAGWTWRPIARLFRKDASESPADPAALPAIVLAGLVWIAIATPIRNGFIREINVAADGYSLEHAREPDGLAKVLVDTWEGDPAAPNALEETLFYDHPPLAERVRRAMDWKAANAAVRR